MNAFEFQAEPTNGHIEIPAEYRGKIAGIVRVIVLSQERSAGIDTLIDRLLDHPLEIENFIPFTREGVY